jgi:hypothetical protein
MKTIKFSPLVAVIAILAAIMACNLPGSTDATPPPATEPPATELVAVVDTPTSPPPTEIPIQHTTIPVSLPENRSGHAGDYDSSVTATQKKSNGGDRFTFEQFERPFNANTMDVYYPNLDIIDTFVFQDDTWIYGTIQVVDRSAANSSPFRFAMQLDVHVDGKGDYLVVAENPTSTDWTVSGVQVYFDANSDVGDLTAMFSDDNVVDDGFETVLFDRGKGDDPDAAWVRASADEPNKIEIAVKRDIVERPALYLVNMWTGHATLDPTLFDYSDEYSHEQAGAADPGFPNFYPIKALYELDNSCRMAVGFQPTGNEPGLCAVIQPAKPGDPPSVCNPTTMQLSLCFQQGGSWNYSTCQCDLPPPVP